MEGGRERGRAEVGIMAGKEGDWGWSELDHSGEVHFVKKKRGVACLLLVWPSDVGSCDHTPHTSSPFSLTQRNSTAHVGW